jgi:hypothetical protein
MLIQNEHGYTHFADCCIPTDASLSGASSYAFSSQVGRVKLRALIFSEGRNALTGLYMQVFKKGNTEVYDYVLRIGVYRKNSTRKIKIRIWIRKFERFFALPCFYQQKLLKFSLHTERHYF